MILLCCLCNPSHDTLAGECSSQAFNQSYQMIEAPVDCIQGQWSPGQRLLCVSEGLARQPGFSLLLDSQGKGAACHIIPAQVSESCCQRLARFAHEVWLLNDEDRISAELKRLVSYRLQSIPANFGERRSLLYAPEVGTVRTFATHQSGALFAHTAMLVSGESELDLQATCSNMQLFGKRVTTVGGLKIDHIPRSPLAGLPASKLLALIEAITTSATLDESTLRWGLAALFGVTTVGVLMLQALGMAGWSVPMADIYAVFFMLVGTAYMWARKIHLNDRQLTYRLIAQALQIHLVWSRAGIWEPVAAHLPLRHHAALKWVRELLRLSAMPVADAGPPQPSRLVLQEWLPQAIATNQQLEQWHAKRATRMALAVRGCYGFSGLLTVLLMVSPNLTGLLDLAAGAVLGISSSIGTLFLIFGGTLGYGANAELHHYLAQLLGRTHEMLKLDLPDHEYDELLLDVGRECIHAAAERAFR